MQIKVEKLPKSTIKLNITIEVAGVKSAYDKVLEEAVKNTQVEGFRKGLAPKKLVEEKIGVSKLYGDVINELLQTYYTQALKENHILPISNPKVEIKEFDLEKDFEFTAVVAVRPEIKIKDYKKALKDEYAKLQSEKAKQNEEHLKKGEKLEESHVHIGTNEVIDSVVKQTELEIPDLVLDEETDRLMSRLVDQANSIGLSLEQYLKAQNKTAEELRKDYAKIAARNLTAEFALAELVTKEKVEVGESEIDEMIKATGDANYVEKLKGPYERLYLKTILQKNKLISKLIEEVEGGNHNDTK